MRPMSAPVVMAPGLAPLGSSPYPMTGLPLAFAGQTSVPGAQGGAPMTAPGAKGTQMVSLGGSCGPKMAFQEMGRDAESLPFDWMCTTVEGVMSFLTSDFQGFFQFNSQETSVLPPSNAKISVFRTPHHSWWHDDPTLPATQEKYRRRIQRLGAMRADSEPILFIRLAATTEELPMADRLSQILVGKFGRKAMLLFIVGNQSPNRVGPYMAGSNQNLLVYFLAAGSGKGVCCPAISVGLNWAAGQTVNSQRFQDLHAIKGLAQPHYYGFFGMGGIPAFDNLPPSALASAPPRADGKSNVQSTQPVQPGLALGSQSTQPVQPGLALGSFQSGPPLGFGGVNSGVPMSSGSVSTGGALSRSCRGVAFTEVAQPLDPLSRSVGPSRRSASRGPSFRSAVAPVLSALGLDEEPPPLVPSSAVAAAAPMLTGDIRSTPHQFSFSKLPAPLDENKFRENAKGVSFNAQDGAATAKPLATMISFDNHGPVANPLLSTVTPADPSLAEAAKTLLSNMSPVDPPPLIPQKQDETDYTKMKSIFKIGDRCEVWSTTHNQWCPGKVQKYDGPMIYIKYRNPAGQLMTKGVPYGHAFLRKA